MYLSTPELFVFHRNEGYGSISPPIRDNRAFFANRQLPNIVGYRSNGVPVLVDDSRGGFYSRLRKAPIVVDYASSTGDLLAFPRAQVFRTNTDTYRKIPQQAGTLLLSSDDNTFVRERANAMFSVNTRENEQGLVWLHTYIQYMHH